MALANGGRTGGAVGRWCGAITHILLALLCSLTAVDSANAQQQPVPAAGCNPPCNRSELCHAGRCVSRCNPPCEPGLMCTPYGDCAPPPQAVPVAPVAPPRYEPARPRSMPYRPGPVPAGYVLDERSITAMWAPGIAVFAVSYAIMAVGSTVDEDYEMLIPVAGPFIQAGQNNCDSSSVEGLCRLGVILLAVDGVLQAVGIGLTIAGLAMRRKRFLRIDVASLSITPAQLAQDSYGLRLSATF